MTATLADRIENLLGACPSRIAAPLAPGFFEARRDFYNLYPLLVHAQLFGGDYANSVARTLERFGA